MVLRRRFGIEFFIDVDRALTMLAILKPSSSRLSWCLVIYAELIASRSDSVVGHSSLDFAEHLSILRFYEPVGPHPCY